MNKDKEWLKAEVENILYGIELRGQVAVTSEGSSIYYAIEKKIDELYEPEVKQLHKKIKKLDSYNDELIRDNNQLRNELNNQEVLSQEFIDEHEQCITGHGADKNGMSQYHHAPFVSVYDLQNLLVPKQNKPVIPQFVADLIEYYKRQGDSLGELLAHIEYENVLKIKLKMLNGVVEWVCNDDCSDSEDKIDLIARAWLDGYEIEKEKLYRIVMPTGHIAYRSGSGISYIGASYRDDSYPEKFTEQEIKAIDKRYWEFAEEVTE